MVLGRVACDDAVRGTRSRLRIRPLRSAYERDAHLFVSLAAPMASLAGSLAENQKDTGARGPRLPPVIGDDEEYTKSIGALIPRLRL